jgi:hypothetical protein
MHHEVFPLLADASHGADSGWLQEDNAGRFWRVSRPRAGWRKQQESERNGEVIVFQATVLFDALFDRNKL